MARQLPAIVPGQRALSRSGDSPSTLSKVVATLAPDLIRAAERMATNRLQNREQARSQTQSPEHREAIQMSEVEIDFSVPFIRKVTMRNMTAWQNAPVEQPRDTKQAKSGGGIGRKIGLLGASSVFALCLGVIARRVGPFSGDDSRVIDVIGKPKP